MKAPKNYYNVVDQKKLGLDQIDKNAAAIAAIEPRILPEATSADEGKVPKVQADGTYALGTDAGLPEVTASDNYKLLQVNNGEWAPTLAPGTISIIGTGVAGSVISSQSLTVRITMSGGIISRSLMGVSVAHSTLVGRSSNNTYTVYITAEGVNYMGFNFYSGSGTIKYFLLDANGKSYIGTFTDSTLTIEPINYVVYLDVTISGTDVTFPTGYDQAAIKALLDTGVDVRLKDDNFRIYELSYNKTYAVDFVNTDVRSSTVILNHINLLSSDNLTGTFNSGTITFDP